MKIVFFLLVAIISSAFQLQASDIVESKVLDEGNYQIEGDFNLGLGSSGSDYIVNSNVGYFVLDKLALDISFNPSSSFGTSAIRLGFGATYYYYTVGALSAFVGQRFDADTRFFDEVSSDTRLGVLYLLAPNVGFNTFAEMNYPLENPRSLSYSLNGSFSFFF